MCRLHVLMTTRSQMMKALALCALAALVAGCGGSVDETKGAAKKDLPAAGEGARAAGAEASPVSAPGSVTKKVTASKAKKRAGVPNLLAPSGSRAEVPLLGVTNDTVEVVYYWKGDQTRTSAFLRGTGAESNVDEAESFRTLVAYLNKHAGGGADFMGHPFNLHGRKIKPTVREVGSAPEDAVATAEEISTQIKPFIAISAHGSLSSYACPLLSKAGVLSVSTFDLGFDLYRRTNGYCIPAGASFGSQVDAVSRYLGADKSQYQSPTGPQRRVYGLLYAEYPELVQAIPTVIDRLSKHITLTAPASVSASTTQAQGQVPGVIQAFKDAGVNTVIIPDAGAALSFTPGAEAQGYRPDYVVWPCSGQDSPAMVRLYNANQWSRASGLTCFDAEFMNDLVHDGPGKRTEWYAKYMSMNKGEPPAQTPYLYANMLPLVVGITNAGRDLNPHTFTAGLNAFTPYRYSGNTGRTAKAENMMLLLDPNERSQIADFTTLRWSTTTIREGSPLTGAYVFPEQGRRYQRDGFE